MRRSVTLVLIGLVMATGCSEELTGEEARQAAFDRAVRSDPIVRDFFDGRRPADGEFVRPEEPVALDDLVGPMLIKNYRQATDDIFVKCFEVQWGGGGPDESALFDFLEVWWTITSTNGVVEQITSGFDRERPDLDLDEVLAYGCFTRADG